MTKELATLAGGCFWCVEAVLARVIGVEASVSGYMGGETENPTYKDICTGRSGHAEVIQITFDSTVVSYRELVQMFFTAHDPTTLNRQGADVGTQYRSAIFYHSDAQREVAELVISELTAEGIFPNPIVTEVTAASTFYPAEAYHQDYYTQNPNQGYCRVVIAPKLQKFKAQFADKLRA